MRALLLIAVIVVLLAPAHEASAVETCDVAQIAGSRELHDVLSHRAIEIVGRAASNSWESDDRLTALVAPSAQFDLGAGDVGRPLPQGARGAHEMAQLMHADTYRFNGLDYMDEPVDACAEHQVEIEFVDTHGQSSSRITFTFRSGRVVSARGSQRSIQTGPVTQGDARAP